MRSTQVSPRDLYGPHADPGNGQVKTIAELFSGWHFRQAAQVRGACCDGPVPDWQLIRAAEANAREIGMRASMPDPAAAGTPEYAADLAQWGDGRGIGPGSSGLPGEPDGPEAGE
jgi:hypothetical protein